MNDAHAAQKPGAPQVREALASVLSSPEFAGADRLKEFLSYVVQEQLAGRGREVRGKNLAVDVYRRAPGDSDAETLVRVDAGRLRRRLDLYYAGTGARAGLRIDIDKGGYAPRFSIVRQGSATTDGDATDAAVSAGPAETVPWARVPIGFKIALGASVTLALVLAVLSASLWSQLSRAPELVRPIATDSGDMVTRRVLFDENPARLQALNLVQQGLGLLLPAPDEDRLKGALTLFERATKLDPDYAGGYAGSALALAMMGAINPPGPKRTEIVDRAIADADAAIRRAPADPYSLAAQAMAAFAAYDDTVALDRIKKAAALAPDDRHIRDYLGLVALFVGELDLALAATDPAVNAALPQERLAWRNVHATARFLTGDPATAIDLLTEGAEQGDPVSIINHGILAASYQRDGQIAKARDAVQRLERAWPDGNLAALLNSLFRNKEHAELVIAELQKAGMTDPSH